MGIAPRESFVILYHEDVAAARRFYEGTLGLEVREVTYDWFVGYWISDKHEMTLCISSSPEERAAWGASGKGVVVDFVVPGRGRGVPGAGGPRRPVRRAADR